MRQLNASGYFSPTYLFYCCFDISYMILTGIFNVNNTIIVILYATYYIIFVLKRQMIMHQWVCKVFGKISH